MDQIYENVSLILDENDLHVEWKVLILRDPKLVCLLYKALVERQGDVPYRKNFLLALSKCSPREIKVVLIGRHPIPYLDMATGLSFSLPPDCIDRNVTSKRKIEHYAGKSVYLLHNALCEAGILEESADYYTDHEEWSQRGVLLLNAALTAVSFERRNEARILKDEYDDTDIWIDFVSLLLIRVAQQTAENKLFYLCWGDKARWVGDKVYERLSAEFCGTGEINKVVKISNFDQKNEVVRLSEVAKFVIFSGNHPTFPMYEEKEFIIQAKLQFQQVDKFYPGLFSLKKIEEPLETDASMLSS